MQLTRDAPLQFGTWVSLTRRTASGQAVLDKHSIVFAAHDRLQEGMEAGIYYLFMLD